MVNKPILFALDSEYVSYPDRIKTAVADIRSKGFDTVCLEIRNSHFSVYTAEGRAALHRGVREARAAGMKAVVAFAYPGAVLFSRYPDARQKWLAEYSALVVNGGFRFEAKLNETADFTSTSPIYLGPRKAFWVRRAGSRIVEAEDVTDRLSYSEDINHAPVIAGKFPKDGELLIFVEWVVDWPDFSHPRINDAVDAMLDTCEGLPLDGMALDEFGAGTRKENVYMSGGSFLRQFEAACGYDFLSRLFLLNNEADGNCAAKTRYDYYKVSVDTTYNVQKYVKEAFTERYGKDVFLGYHHTWWGEGNSGDLWGANIDYFRLAKNSRC